MNRPTLAISLALFALTACADHTLHAEDYNKTCTATDQCIDVFIGDACDTCHCANDAINIAEADKYLKDSAEAGKCRLGGPVCNVECLSKAPVCQNGTCVIPP